MEKFAPVHSERGAGNLDRRAICGPFEILGLSPFLTKKA